MTKKQVVPLSYPSLGNEEIKAVKAVLQSGWVAHGFKNEEFEQLLAEYFGVREAIVVNSGASALLLSLLALDIKGEVIVPSFTMAASVNAIVLTGATPVFCEVELDTGNLDPRKIREEVTSKTQALMPVHFAGRTCRMDEILSIAREYRLKVIEDSAETIGGKYKGRYAGTFGDIGCFSFWATKNITTGEGGAILTNDQYLAKKIRLLMAHGIPSTTLEREKLKKSWYRDTVLPGFNMRMSNINAAIGVEQLKKLNRLNNARRKRARYLTEKLSGIEGIHTPGENKDVFHVYQMYVIRLDDSSKRDQYVKQLRKRKIMASVHFDPPVHLQTYYQKCLGRNSLPITEKLSASVITLPLYPDMSFKDLDYIAKSIREIIISN